MKKFVLAILLATMWSATLWAQPVPANANPIRVLLVDGQSGGPYHAWQFTTAVLKKELEDAGIFSVTVATSPKFGEDFSGFKPDFKAYQAVVMNYDAPDWPANLREQLEQYVKNGGVEAAVVLDRVAGPVLERGPEIERFDAEIPSSEAA